MLNLIKKISVWGNHHHPKWLGYFRILLGIVLIWKGVAFAMNLDAFGTLMRNSNIGIAASISLIAHLIIAVHIIGGLFITIGSYTRFFCLLNLPIVFMAVFFVNLDPAVFRPYSELWLSVAVLIGLISFLVFGNGKLSVEYRRKNS